MDCKCGLPVRGTSGDPRHTRLSRYRCSLPGLAGFAGPRCTEPEVPRSGSRANFPTAEKSLAQLELSHTRRTRRKKSNREKKPRSFIVKKSCAAVRGNLFATKIGPMV